MRTARALASAICGTLPKTLTLARRIKELHPSLPVVLGGPQASSVPGELIATYDFIDGIVIGEAEHVVGPLWAAICAGRPSTVSTERNSARAYRSPSAARAASPLS